MKIELPIRWKGTRELSDDEQLQRRVLNQEEEEIEFSYGFITLDTADIRTWNPSDENCITLRTYFEDAYTIAIEHEEFNKLWTQLTGQDIVRIRMKEVKKSKSIKAGKI